MVFNIPFDWIYGKCYPLHAKPKLFLLLLWLLLIQQFSTNQDFSPLEIWSKLNIDR